MSLLHHCYTKGESPLCRWQWESPQALAGLAGALAEELPTASFLLSRGPTHTPGRVIQASLLWQVPLTPPRVREGRGLVTSGGGPRH